MPAMRAIIARFGARSRRLVFALVGWIALLTVGAGRAPDSDSWIVQSTLSNLLLLLAATAAVVGTLIITFRGPPISDEEDRRRRVPAWTWITVVAVLLLTMVLAALAPGGPLLEDSPLEINPSLQAPIEGSAIAGQPGVTGAQPGGPTEETGGANAGDVALLLVLAVVALLVLRRTGFWATTDEPQSPDSLAPKLGPALDDAAEQLSIAADPRSGVMAAYAALERALAERRSDRRRTETPSEHMARALAAFPVIKRPAVLLAHLYELARFSDYPITAADRDRAGAALSEARRSLTAVGDDRQ